MLGNPELPKLGAWKPERCDLVFDGGLCTGLELDPMVLCCCKPEGLTPTGTFKGFLECMIINNSNMNSQLTVITDEYKPRMRPKMDLILQDLRNQERKQKLLTAKLVKERQRDQGARVRTRMVLLETPGGKMNVTANLAEHYNERAK